MIAQWAGWAVGIEMKDGKDGRSRIAYVLGHYAAVAGWAGCAKLYPTAGGAML